MAVDLTVHSPLEKSPGQKCLQFYLLKPYPKVQLKRHDCAMGLDRSILLYDSLTHWRWLSKAEFETCTSANLLMDNPCPQQPNRYPAQISWPGVKMTQANPAHPCCRRPQRASGLSLKEAALSHRHQRRRMKILGRYFHQNAAGSIVLLFEL